MATLYINYLTNIIIITILQVQYSVSLEILHKYSKINARSKVGKHYSIPENYYLQFYFVQFNVILNSELLPLREKLYILDLLIVQNPETISNNDCRTPSSTDITAAMKHHQPVTIVLQRYQINLTTY